jgi:hypothetical protein
MTKSDIKDWLGGFGCFTIILIILALVLLVIPAILFIGATIWGCLAYLGWNLAIAPIFGLAPIVMWWQAFGIGVILTILSALLKGIVVKKGD